MMSAEERLILLGAATADRRRATHEQMAELAREADWWMLAQLLSARRLLSLLGPRLVEFAERRSAREFELALERALQANRRHGALLQLVTERLLAALNDAGIACVALKGPQLSDTLYSDPGRRSCSDIDLLVAREQLHDAVAVVRKLGYTAPADHVDDDGLPLLHFALAHEHDRLPPVELHWRIHWYERRFAAERLLPPPGRPLPPPGRPLPPPGRPLPPPERAAEAWRPAHIDELLALLLFYARDGFLDLRHATDIGAYWDAFGAELELGALDRSLSAYPELAPVLTVAASIAEQVVGLPLGQLSAHPAALSKRGRIALSLAGPRPYTSESQLYADMGLIDGLLAPPGGFWEFVRRQVVPPRAVREQYASTSTMLGHSVRTLGRYGLAIGRLRCGARGVRVR